MLTLKFVTDGTPRGSHIYCTETGEEIKNIRSVDIHADPAHLPTMILEVIKMKIDANGMLDGYEMIDGDLVIEKVACELPIDVNVLEQRKDEIEDEQETS